MELDKIRDKGGNFPAYTWPGFYPMFYLTADCGVLCPDCANCDEAKQADDDQWRLVAYDVNWEDPCLYCDDCSKRIESAYAEED